MEADRVENWTAYIVKRMPYSMQMVPRIQEDIWLYASSTVEISLQEEIKMVPKIYFILVVDTHKLSPLLDSAIPFLWSCNGYNSYNRGTSCALLITDTFTQLSVACGVMIVWIHIYMIVAAIICWSSKSMLYTVHFGLLTTSWNVWYNKISSIYCVVLYVVHNIIQYVK